MSSISSLGSSQYTYSSPLQQLEAELQSEVSAGTVSSSDQSALSSALTSIDSSLSAGQSSSSSQTSTDGTGGSGPGDIKSKINSLIQAQVASGALTSDQATELQNLFSNTFGNGPGGSGGPGGPGGPQGSGGPPPGPLPSGGSSSASSSASAIAQLLDSSSSTDTSSTDGSSTDSTSLSNILQDFLKQLQDSPVPLLRRERRHGGGKLAWVDAPQLSGLREPRVSSSQVGMLRPIACGNAAGPDVKPHYCG